MTTTITTLPYTLRDLLIYKKSAPVVEETHTWAKLVPSYQELPDVFRGVLPERAEFPYTLYLPEGEPGLLALKKQPAQLLALYRDHLVVLEAKRGEVSTNGYALQSLNSLEHGHLLLQSWLSLKNHDSAATFTFNTVAEQLLGPVITAIRSGAYQPESTPVDLSAELAEHAKLSYLWKRNLKYFNLAQESLLPGTKIVASVYQPEVELPEHRFLQALGSRKALTAHVALFTDRELILIRDAQKTVVSGKTVYGGISNYLPLSQIQHISFQKTRGPRDWAMEVTLFDYSYLRAEFSSAAVNLEEFQTHCRTQFGSRTN